VTKHEKRLVVGVDGSNGRWVAVALRGRRFVDARILDTLADVLSAWPEAGAVGVDTPIGLPRPEAFPRRADTSARELLPGATARVFLTYPREVYEAPTHEEATACAVAVVGKGISRQAWALRRAILDAAALDDPRVFEVHPELSFAAIRREVLRPKTTWQGLAERIDALRLEGIEIPLDHDAASAPPDDVLDAAVVAWTARRRLRGRARPVPRDVAADEPAIWV
jgi:predicted RNase H-like nuclease